MITETICAELYDEITKAHYVKINGVMFVRRDDLSKLPLSYISRDFINRIGESNGDAWWQEGGDDI